MQRLVLQQVLPWVQKPPLHRIPTTGHKAIQTVGDCQITILADDVFVFDPVEALEGQDVAHSIAVGGPEAMDPVDQQ